MRKVTRDQSTEAVGPAARSFSRFHHKTSPVFLAKPSSAIASTHKPSWGMRFTGCSYPWLSRAEAGDVPGAGEWSEAAPAGTPVASASAEAKSELRRRLDQRLEGTTKAFHPDSEAASREGPPRCSYRVPGA